MKYSPRRIDGAGLFDGEATERMWSQFSKFSHISKQQDLPNRHDLLVEALLNIGVKQEQKQGINFGKFLEQLDTCDFYETIDSMEGIRKNCALSDKFLSFGMKVGMVQEISKTTANKVGLPPGGWFALNPIWPP